MTDKVLRDLVLISNVTGQDSTLVQAGGGNTSVKSADGRYMYIKASGCTLKDMSLERGWRRLRVGPVLAILQDAELAKMDTSAREIEIVNRLLKSCDDAIANAGRPSVESHLHALLDQYVIHLHPMVVGAYVNSVNGQKRIAKLFGKLKKPPMWVSYADPGFCLAQALKRGVEAYQEQYGSKPSVIFLEKHGLIASAGNAAAALKLVDQTITLCKKGLKKAAKVKVKSADADAVQDAKMTLRAAMFDATGDYTPVTHVIDDAISAFMMRPDAKKILSQGPLAPDEMVYSNGQAVYLDKVDRAAMAKAIRSRVEKGQGVPLAWLIKPLGLFIAADSKKAGYIREIASGACWVRSQAAGLGGVATLTTKEQLFIRKWESESFRLGQLKAAAAGALKNRIAVVTGAGSGLGRSIAIGLARASAMVVIADIDATAATETATKIKAEQPGAFVEIMQCNVTSEESVTAGFEKLASLWGGVDIVVNAAGVAPAYPLVDLPVEKWRFALEVNLTGYFLMAKVAAKMMIRQGMGGNIINISSKTGLDASKNNTPYNATKAGELHMARGWAMELGQYGIRVNSVCPGNVFEGSKIWNPTYIKECAKKYGIKPEEVIPFYVNKTILKKEIMGQDIADAVVFLCSDRARTITGQTLVADAGQVMVR